MEVNRLMFYQFQETGVGCEAHSSTDCLCDVKVGPPVPIVKLPRLAPFPPGFDSPALEFIVWASGTLGRFEALAGVKETELNEALAIWEGKGAEGGSHRSAQRSTAASMCLKAGLTLEQTSRWLSTSLLDIMDLLYPGDRHEMILKLEGLIRAGKTTKQIADETGLAQNYIGDVARRWNVELPHAGVRYGPEVRTKVRSMVKAGKSRRATAKELGLSETRVSTWCQDLPGTQLKRRSQ